MATNSGSRPVGRAHDRPARRRDHEGSLHARARRDPVGQVRDQGQPQAQRSGRGTPRRSGLPDPPGRRDDLDRLRLRADQHRRHRPGTRVPDRVRGLRADRVDPVRSSPTARSRRSGHPSRRWPRSRATSRSSTEADRHRSDARRSGRPRFVAANGARFHVVEAHSPASRAGSAPVVVLLHGFPHDWWSWRHQLTPLAEAGYRAIAMDLRGYGDSDKTPRGYDPMTLAADVAGTIRSLGARDAVVVGLGWGGYVAWTVAAGTPRRRTRVVRRERTSSAGDADDQSERRCAAGRLIHLAVHAGALAARAPHHARPLPRPALEDVVLALHRLSLPGRGRVLPCGAEQMARHRIVRWSITGG